jgi:hypothetical protein
MDRKLIFTQKVLDLVTKDFNKYKSSILEVEFEIWTKIPENVQYSYYLNEQIISPSQETFEEWKNKLYQRPKPIYSVAVYNENIISSIYGAELPFERTMNLWITQPDFRKKGIGRIVLLNFIKYCFENNPDMHINAWDITSRKIDNVLTNIGFT